MSHGFVALKLYIYLRQVNGVNGGDTGFVRCVCVSDICAQRPVMRGRSWELNANSSKTVKATDFKFDRCSQGQSGHDPQKFSQKGRGHGHVTP